MGKKQAKVFKFVPTSKEGKKAGIYIRVSSNEFLLSRREERKKEKEAQEAHSANPTSAPETIEDKVRQSVATQKEDAIRYCKKQEPPWYYETYEDNEISGTLGKDERPDLDKLLADVAAGKIHTIIVRDVKRLARNARLLKDIIDDYLIPNGVELIGLFDNIHISTPYARFFTAILGEVAELEVAYIRETTMRNREQAALDGTLAHCSFVYGYESIGRRQIGVVEEEAEIVKQVFKEYVINKTSANTIADMLTTQKTPMRWGAGRWGPGRIRDILTNPRYIGRINYRQHKMLPSPFPPIVDEKLWYAAQEERKRRGSYWTTNTELYSFAGGPAEMPLLSSTT